MAFKINTLVLQLLVVLVSAAYLIWKAWPDSDAHLIFCDVGQGDAILIMQGDKQLLIDSGPDTKVLGCLTDHLPLGDHTLETVVLTHPDADHLAGFLSILPKYHINTFLIEARVTDTKTYQNFLTLLHQKEKEGTQVILPQMNDHFQLNSNIFVQVLFPLTPIGDKKVLFDTLSETQLSAVNQAESVKYGDTNDGSIALFVTIYHTKIMLTGDLGREGELAILKNSMLNHIHIWKAAHHGSKSANSIELLTRISPEVIVISAGKNNTYHLPSPEILKRFNSIKAKIYRTDLQKTIDFRINSMKYFAISIQ